MCLSTTLTTPSGGSTKHTALLDSGTTVDCIPYELVSQLDWDQLETPIGIIEMLNRAEADWYGIYEAQLTMTDSLGTTKVVKQTFTAIDMVNMDVVLGMLWLEDFNPDIDWKDKMWHYCLSEESVEFLNAGRFF